MTDIVILVLVFCLVIGGMAEGDANAVAIGIGAGMALLLSEWIWGDW